MSVPVIDPPEDAESIRSLLQEIRNRLGICIGSYLLAFVLVCVPIPYLPDVSITQTVVIWFLPPAADYLMYIKPGEGFWLYFQAASLSAFALDQPVIIYQLLALVAPPRFVEKRQRPFVAVIALSSVFVLGVVTGFILLLPSIDAYLLRLQELGDESPIRGSFFDHGLFKLHVVFMTGLAFQLPLWPAILVRLGALSIRRLVRIRPYVLLAVVIVAAWITPTTDLLSMTIVAAPLYLFYEAGLLLARLVPTQA